MRSHRFPVLGTGSDFEADYHPQDVYVHKPRTSATSAMEPDFYTFASYLARLLGLLLVRIL